MNFFKHETAIIDEGAEIGKDCRIWHWVHICGQNVKIGQGCSLGQNVFVGNNVSIGNKVKIQNNVSVYDRVTLEDEVFCGPSMVFTNVINPRSAIERKSEYLETIVRKGASIGANATIICGNEIGHHAFVAAGAVVTKNVKPFALMAGVPAQQIGWMCACGNRLNKDLESKGESQCQHCGRSYKLTGDQLELV